MLLAAGAEKRTATKPILALLDAQGRDDGVGHFDADLEGSWGVDLDELTESFAGAAGQGQGAEDGMAEEQVELDGLRQLKAGLVEESAATGLELVEGVSSDGAGVAGVAATSTVAASSEDAPLVAALPPRSSFEEFGLTEPVRCAQRIRSWSVKSPDGIDEGKRLTRQHLDMAAAWKPAPKANAAGGSSSGALSSAGRAQQVQRSSFAILCRQIPLQDEF